MSAVVLSRRFNVKQKRRSASRPEAHSLQGDININQMIINKWQAASVISTTNWMTLGAMITMVIYSNDVRVKRLS